MNSDLFNICKEFLDTEEKVNDDTHSHMSVGLIPITHNDNQIILQFNGWSINLNLDGTWFWEATDGG